MFQSIVFISHSLYAIRPSVTVPLFSTSTVQPLRYIDRFIWIFYNQPHVTIVIIFQLPKQTTALNGPYTIGPKVSQAREVSLYV